MSRVALMVLACGLFGAGTPASDGSGAVAFAAAVAKARLALAFDGGVFGGPGANVISDAIDDAQYVMIGEDHGIAEIPTFSTALCRTVAPHGFTTLAVEIGPSTAKVLSAALASPDPEAAVAAYDKQHPFSIAFYDFAQEVEFLRSCRQVMGADRFALWGLDQELMGSSGALLAAQTAAVPAQRRAELAELNALATEDAGNFARAMKSGSPGDMSMVNFDQGKLQALRDRLAAAGVDVTPLSELIVSEQIYREDMSGLRQSNLDRAQLQLNHFIAADRFAFAATGVHPKVLVKMGAYHLFEGTSMLGDRELGNFLMEYAALQGKPALNIIVLGVKGQQLAFAGMGQPYAPIPLDLLHDKRADFNFLRPFFDGLGTTPVLYDLRTLRGALAHSGLQSINLERVVDGYDLLVVIPVAHPSQQV